ncbi:MAG: hypothetical protein NTV51_32395 [Verrucomicrobia bacterium]|nr:hypothetical protein [Verrucomicrobiota bacterium]
MLRRLLQSSLLALVAATPFTARASVVSGPVGVVAVQPTRVADLVLLGRGFDAGLRQGMVCRVTRGGAEIAEVLLVDLRPTCASALIVAQAAGQSLRAGDLASVKILKAQS